MIIKARARSASQTRDGFTLIELLLVVALVLLLTSALVFNFSTLLRGNQLTEGTTRLETLMRFARAQAANSGRKVQIVFSGESTNLPAASTGEVRATWEPDPLGQPGCFADLIDTQWHVQELNDMVQVESVKLLDASTACPSATSAESEEWDDAEFSSAKPMAPITFYPDGSSDSAEIIVAARSPEEDQRMSVRLIGMTGSISHQLLSADSDENASEAALAERTLMSRRESATIRDPAMEPETTSRQPASHQIASSSRTISTTPRAPVGETNSVDKSD